MNNQVLKLAQWLINLFSGLTFILFTPLVLITAFFCIELGPLVRDIGCVIRQHVIRGLPNPDKVEELLLLSVMEHCIKTLSTSLSVLNTDYFNLSLEDKEEARAHHLANLQSDDENISYKDFHPLFLIGFLPFKQLLLEVDDLLPHGLSIQTYISLANELHDLHNKYTQEYVSDYFKLIGYKQESNKPTIIMNNITGET